MYGFSWQTVAAAAGYNAYGVAETADGLTATLARMDEASGVGSAAAFVEVKLALGTREELGRPTVSTHECKEALMAFLEE